MIIVNGDQIANSGKFIKDKANELNTKINEINDCLDKISIAWQGSKSTQYLNNMRSKYVVALKELKERLNDCGEYLTRVPDTYSTLDETYGHKNIGV